MSRREFLARLAGAGGVLSVIGLTAYQQGLFDAPSKAAFEYEPLQPVVGEPVVFDASQATGENFTWEVGSHTNAPIAERTGEMMSWTFDSRGVYPVKLSASYPGPNGDSDSIIQRVPIAESSSAVTSGHLDIEDETVDIAVRASQSQLTLNSSTVVQANVTNLTTDEGIIVTVVTKIPTGFDVTGVANVDSGTGQYSMRQRVGPGQTGGMQVDISPNRTGRFEVVVAVTYRRESESDGVVRSTSLPIVVE
jgi:hypothetical protein